MFNLQNYSDKMSKEIHAQNKARGWWDDPYRCDTETLYLVVSENIEGLEGLRKDLMDDKLPHRKMAEVELADAVIRMYDYAGKNNLKLLRFLRKDDAIIFASESLIDSAKNTEIGYLAALSFIALGLALNISISEHSMKVYGDSYYTVFIEKAFAYAKQYKYDLVGAIEEKLEFNKTRADHSRENRAKANGKKF
jgi:hypothetical protein